MVTPFPENLVEMLNASITGFDKAMGVRFVEATPDQFIVELDIDRQHLQPHGLVHGGVYAGTIEMLCSTAAALTVMGEGKTAVGLENNTSFLRATRAGTLRFTARPAVRGRRTHVWQADVTDADNRLVATGKVRLMILDGESSVRGEQIGVLR